MSPEVLTVLGIILNGAVTWGVVSTKLEWLRADVNRAHRRLDQLEAKA